MGDVGGVSAGLGDTVPLGLEAGNANVADGDADSEGEFVDVGVANGEGLGVGVGGGGIMFSQWCSGTVAPPISFTSVWERA